MNAIERYQLAWVSPQGAVAAAEKAAVDQSLAVFRKSSRHFRKTSLREVAILRCAIKRLPASGAALGRPSAEIIKSAIQRTAKTTTRTSKWHCSLLRKVRELALRQNELFHVVTRMRTGPQGRKQVTVAGHAVVNGSALQPPLLVETAINDTACEMLDLEDALDAPPSAMLQSIQTQSASSLWRLPHAFVSGLTAKQVLMGDGSQAAPRRRVVRRSRRRGAGSAAANAAATLTPSHGSPACEANNAALQVPYADPPSCSAISRSIGMVGGPPAQAEMWPAHSKVPFFLTDEMKQVISRALARETEASTVSAETMHSGAIEPATE